MWSPPSHAGSLAPAPAPAELHAGPISLPHRPFPLPPRGETHVTGGHIHDCVATRISWIRGRRIRTPWCSEEVPSPGQRGVNYILSPSPLLTATNRKSGGGWEVAEKNASRAKVHESLLAMATPPLCILKDVSH